MEFDFSLYHLSLDEGLEISALVQSLKSSNVEHSEYMDRKHMFKCCLSVAAKPYIVG